MTTRLTVDTMTLTGLLLSLAHGILRASRSQVTDWTTMKGGSMSWMSARFNSAKPQAFDKTARHVAGSETGLRTQCACFQMMAGV